MNQRAAVILALACVATGAQAQSAPDTRGLPLIPKAYHGRWPDNPTDCRRPSSIQTNFVTITARGWSDWEDGGYVTGAGPARGAVRTFAVMNQNGGEADSKGTLALQLLGARRVAMTFVRKGEKPVRYVMTRCR